jgi:hypothetical protein
LTVHEDISKADLGQSRQNHTPTTKFYSICSFATEQMTGVCPRHVSCRWLEEKRELDWYVTILGPGTGCVHARHGHLRPQAMWLNGG